ncbi:MAG: LysE family transporter [Chitinophagaceae bacterium]|nr:LysE family transporter [Chitinophagaceae bacterium]
MRPLLKIFGVGLLISFLGSLPLATMNIAAMQISISDGIGAAMLFSFGSLMVEMMYVRFSLVALDWIRKQKLLFKILEYVTLAIVLALAAFSFYAALHPGEQKNAVLDSSLPKFILGAAMCAVSPGQIPFWLGWSTVLFTKKILLPRKDHYNTYILGIGIGTFIGNCIFIFGGVLIADTINRNQHIVSWVIGGIFLATAIFQIIKMLKKRDPVEQLTNPEVIKEEIEKKREQLEKTEIAND